MPCRKDIKSILIPGSGPIVIGQACEFDYSGTQACKVLRKEGFRIILLNSNPATIMTDPELAEATYVEPLTAEIAEEIIAIERPDAFLPTVGGQTALNLSMELYEAGVFTKYNVELLGASIKAIRRAESRKEFKVAIEELGLQIPISAFCSSIQEAKNFLEKEGLPLVIRPSFTLGGTGGGIAHTQTEFNAIVKAGLEASPANEILVEKSIFGWKEYELEVMCDSADNVVIVCSIENLDPMGIHTGDSITVAPQQTLNDVQYQEMRNAAIAIIRKIGVTTGGSNIQFAVNPKNGEMIVIEMNPRVSRSSALASKATGFPIAKIAAQLAVGYTLDELQNEITKATPCSFEPSIDYVVTKAPRFAFEKFSENKDTLGTTMRSVGESMGIGRTFKASLQKAMRSLENSHFGLGADGALDELLSDVQAIQEDKAGFLVQLEKDMARPHPNRIFDIKKALEWGFKESNPHFSVENIAKMSGIDPWFLAQILELIEIEFTFVENANEKDALSRANLLNLKELGYSDRQLAFLKRKEDVIKIASNQKLTELTRRNQITTLLKEEEKKIFQIREKVKLFPIYKRVDTCGGEFESHTPYLYSAYETEDEANVSKKKKVVILGSGPNRIGQGVEFDYCCCHASLALQEMGIESIMINSNPETVSTDYDTSDKLYFEPLTFEDVLHICRHEKPDGLIVSFGGQTPLSLAKALVEANVPLWGTPLDAIDKAEDRDRFSGLLKKIGLKHPPCGLAHNIEEAKKIIEEISYPVLIRPSYVLGGRAMVVVSEEKELKGFMQKAVSVSPEHPIFIDHFLENAIEIDVDALADGDAVFIGGIMQHIEEAGIHSGDSACVLPALDLSPEITEEIKKATRAIALELGVIGLLNIQFGVYQKNQLYVIEVNPRASRTIPFVSKAIGLPLAKLAVKLMCGKKIKELGIESFEGASSQIVAVKEAVLPFARFPESDIILGPEMKSTGEVMGIGTNIGQAYIKAQLGTGERIPRGGGVFFSICDSAKGLLLESASTLIELGFVLYSTKGTALFLEGKNIPVHTLHKMKEKKIPNPLSMMQEKKISAIINIPDTRKTRDDALVIRQAAVQNRILCVTTVAGTKAMVGGLQSLCLEKFQFKSLQKLHQHIVIR